MSDGKFHMYYNVNLTLVQTFESYLCVGVIVFMENKNTISIKTKKKKMRNILWNEDRNTQEKWPELQAHGQYYSSASASLTPRARACRPYAQAEVQNREEKRCFPGCLGS